MKFLKSKRARRNRLKRDGATMVEFAIAAPILFMLLMTVFEFGWQVLIRHTADNAAYEAARKAIVPGGTAQDAIDEANRIMGIVGARSFSVGVNPPTINPSTPEVEVTITARYDQNGIIASNFLSNVQFTSRSKLLTERPRRD